jgi:hypothetical protein
LHANPGGFESGRGEMKKRRNGRRRGPRASCPHSERSSVTFKRTSAIDHPSPFVCKRKWRADRPQGGVPKILEVPQRGHQFQRARRAPPEFFAIASLTPVGPPRRRWRIRRGRG